MNKDDITNGDSYGRNWMVVYTKSKCEKKTDHLMKVQGIASFCPLVRTKRKWADRYKIVEVPLFSSYVFVHIHPRDQHKVQQIAGVVNFIYDGAKPAVLGASDIEKIRVLMDQCADIEAVSLSSIKPGDQVMINDGILFDIHGEVLEIQGKSILLIMKQLDCALIAKVKVNANQILLTGASSERCAVIN